MSHHPNWEKLLYPLSYDPIWSRPTCGANPKPWTTYGGNRCRHFWGAIGGSPGTTCTSTHQNTLNLSSDIASSSLCYHGGWVRPALPETFNVNFGRNAKISVGTVPVRKLVCNSRFVKFNNKPIWEGITPLKMFVFKRKSVRLVTAPIEVGILPLRKFSPKFK